MAIAPDFAQVSFDKAIVVIDGNEHLLHQKLKFRVSVS